MAVETHWICDVCNKRIIKSDNDKDVNESGIKRWFVVNLNIHHVEDPIKGKRAFKYGYACSEECLNAVIDWMKKLTIKEMKKEEK